MQLLTLRQASLRSTDTVFRHAWGGGLAVTLITGGGAAGLFLAGASGEVPWWLPAIPGMLLLLMAALFGVTTYRAMLSTAWLLAADGTRVLIKLRSYLNHHFPPDDPQVLELSGDDIMAARRLDERTTTGSSDGATTLKHTFLEIRVARGVDLEPLRRQLAYERGLAKKAKKGWGDYPVLVVGNEVIRVEWKSPRRRIRPGIDEALRVIGARVADAAQQSVDLTHPESMARDEVERRVRVLAERGELLAALRLASDGLGLELTEAKALVEKIQSGG